MENTKREDDSATVEVQSSKRLEKTTEATYYGIVIQILFKILGFAINYVVIRNVSQEYLGIVNVHMQLMYTTLMVLARECFRKVCSNPRHYNVLWLIIPVGFIIDFALSYIWLTYLYVSNVNGYYKLVILYFISSMIEMVSEPMYLHFVVNMNYKIRMIADGIASIVRSIFILTLSYFCHDDISIFGISQIIYSILLFSIAVLYLEENLASFYGRLASSLDFESVFLLLSFMYQYFIKQILSESERYIMTIFQVLSYVNQAIYDIINNLLTIILRLFLLPVEESFFIYFNQELNSRNVNSPRQVQIVLVSILKFLVLLSMTIITYGYFYFPVLFRFYLGNSMMGFIGYIRLYTIYVSILCIYGTLDAFFNASVDKDTLNSYTNMCIFLSIFSTTLMYFLQKSIHVYGLVIANIFNVSVRTLHHISYSNNYYNAPIIFDVMPEYQVIFVFIATNGFLYGIGTLIDPFESIMNCVIYLSIGGMSGIITIFMTYKYETELCLFIYHKILKRKIH